MKLSLSILKGSTLALILISTISTTAGVGVRKVDHDSEKSEQKTEKVILISEIHEAVEIDTKPQDDTEDIFYISLHEAFNSQVDKPESDRRKFLDQQRSALFLALNHVSRSDKIVLPEVVNVTLQSRKLRNILYRIKVSDFGWKKVWKNVVNRNSYLFSEDLKLGSPDLRVVRADWLISEITQAPHYYRLLGIKEKTREELERRILQGDTSAELIKTAKSQSVVRTILKSSKGTLKDHLTSRVLERIQVNDMHGADGGSYRVAYSVPASTHIAKSPLGPEETITRSQKSGMLIADTHAFPLNTVAISYQMPNGLTAFLLADSLGNLVKTPEQLPDSPYRTNSSLLPGQSCFKCHSSGILSDKLTKQSTFSTDTLVKNQSVETSIEITVPKSLQHGIRRLYPSLQKYTDLLKQDKATHQAAVQKTVLSDENTSVTSRLIWEIGTNFILKNQLVSEKFIQVYGKNWNDTHRELAKAIVSYYVDRSKDESLRILNVESERKKLAQRIEAIAEGKLFNPLTTPENVGVYYVISSKNPQEVGAKVKYVKSGSRKHVHLFKVLKSRAKDSPLNYQREYHLLNLAAAARGDKACNDGVCVGDQFQAKLGEKNLDLSILAVRSDGNFVANWEAEKKEDDVFEINFSFGDMKKTKIKKTARRVQEEKEESLKRKQEEKQKNEAEHREQKLIQQAEILHEKVSAQIARRNALRRHNCIYERQQPKSFDWGWNSETNKCVRVEISPREKCNRYGNVWDYYEEFGKERCYGLKTWHRLKQKRQLRIDNCYNKNQRSKTRNYYWEDRSCKWKSLSPEERCYRRGGYHDGRRCITRQQRRKRYRRRSNNNFWFN